MEKLTGPGLRTRFLLTLLTEGSWGLPPGEPWTEAGAMAGINRYELKLEPAAPATVAPAGPVTMDIERTKTEGWKVKALRFDAALVAQAASILKPKGITVDAAALTDPPDALDQARRFLTGVLSHDFKAARSITDQVKVTHERLAGMCIVFEEGEYHIAAKRPVVVTAGTENTAWAIIKVRSDKQDLESEVGLEMERSPAGVWSIHALDFNKMLESYVKATGTGNVFYSPIVKSAKGGESIVLYFEFDKSELHPRALHQLDIIASLLKSDPARKMRITGHSDALGTDDYNVRLSAVRAKNVRARLLELGVSATQIVTAGVGSKAPLDPDRRADGSDNPDGRSRNRRTEIYLDF
jgi:outer membrane protein OmpA-like peptidoglycan-associated protein